MIKEDRQRICAKGFDKMLISSLLVALGNPTSHVKNKQVLTDDFCRATVDSSSKCILLHNAGDAPVLKLKRADTVPLADDVIHVATAQSLTSLLATIQAALQWDYEASQTYETLQLPLPGRLTLPDLIERIAQQLNQTLVLYDGRQSKAVPSSVGPLGRLPVRQLTTLLATLGRPTGHYDQIEVRGVSLVTLTLAHRDVLALTAPQPQQLAFTLGLLQRLGRLFQRWLPTLSSASTPRREPSSPAYFSTALLNLIHSKTINATTLKQWDLPAEQLAYILQVSFHHRLDSVVVNNFLSVLTPLVGNVQYCLENETMVVSCRTSRPLNTQLSVLKSLYQDAKQYAFTIAISTPFTTVEQISSAYQQCVTVQAYAVTVPLPERILFYQDVALLDLIDQVKGHADLRAYIHPDLHYLMAYDAQHHTDYLNTLHFYLYNDCQTKSAARDLHIHPNTLLYRMGKIKALLHYDFSFGKQNLDYRMGFLILYSQNKLALPHTRQVASPE